MPFDVDLFRSVPLEFRLVPFWFWNAAMQDDEIVYQIQQIAEQGVGGFFICARQGLTVPYLSAAWFQFVAVAVAAAQQYGMHVWLYDEYPYPSGMSGGEVTLQHPDAKQQQLLHFSTQISGPFNTFSFALPWARLLSAQAVPLAQTTAVPLWSQALDLQSYVGSVATEAVFQSTGLTTYTNKRFFSATLRKQLLWPAPAGCWLLNFFLEKEIEDFKYFGNYMDPCHKAAVQTFLATTHERYAHYFKDHFGQTIKGMFTDEVGLLGRIPWSSRLPAFFRERYGYDLVEQLPALLYPQGDATARVRYHFFQSVHLLLNSAYHEPVGTWCDAHHLQYVTEVQSTRMTTQRYSHIPAGDTAHEKIGRSLEWILDRSLYSLRANPKFVSSIARQMGRTRAAIECFHSVGWSMTLQDAKWMLDCLAGQGINFFVFHAFFYSISGLRKHDAPPSQFLQNPYWRYFRQLADYAARLSYTLSQGQAQVSIALLHPTTSFWTHMGNPFSNFKYSGNDKAEADALERLKQDWAYLCKELLWHQFDYDHLDAELLATAAIEDGQLIIGHALYTLLILPPMTNLETAAWQQVQAFLRAGGKVISLGLLPYEQIDSVQPIENEMLECFGLTDSPRLHYWQNSTGSPDAQRWTQGTHSAYFIGSTGSLQQTQAIEPLLTLLKQCVPPDVTLEPLVGTGRSLLMQRRSLSDGSQLIFIAHQEGSKQVLRLHLAKCPSGQSVERLDITTGNVTAYPVEQDVDGWAVQLAFAPYESYLLRFSYSTELPTTAKLSSAPHELLWQFVLAMQQPWQLTAQQDNILRCGSFRFALDLAGVGLQQRWHEGGAGQTWPLVEAKPLIQQCADVAADQTFPLQFSQTFGVPMRFSLTYPLHCWYQTTFHTEQIPTTCNLLMDEGAIEGTYMLYLNGAKLTAQDFVPHFQPGQRQLSSDVQQFIRRGENHLVIHVEAQRDGDGVCDPLYLSGPFGVFIATPPVATIDHAPQSGIPHAGVQQGYPYYAGTLCFSREVLLASLPATKSFEIVWQDWDAYLHDCIEVLVNGHSLGVCCWSPYHWEGACALLQEGKNTLEVRVTNTLSGKLDGTYFNELDHKIVSVAEFLAES